MDILFNSESEKNLYNNERELKRKFGQMSKIIGKRLDQIRSTSSIAEYLNMGLGKPHFLNGNYEKCISVNLTGNYRLIIEPVYPEETSFDAINLSILKIVTIVEVTDYHGN